MTRKDFSRSCQYHRNYLNAYYMKGPNLTWRIAGVSIWQESLRQPSVTDRWRKYSLGVPCNSSWTICILLCPQNLKNLERFWSILLIPDSKYLYGIRNYLQLPTPRNYLFMPDMNYLRKHSFRVRIYLYRVWNINTGSEIIHLSWQFRGFYSY